MEQKVYDFIQCQELIEMDDHIVVGVSGGADSICLLYLLWGMREKLQIKITAIHINHGIRGIEAKEDEDFVRDFCQRLGIELECFFFDIKEIAKKKKVSEEEAGRFVRYQCFNQTLEKYKKGKIAVAHHKNDQAETVLMNLIRGTGLNGLLGMQPKRDNIIRPLLGCSRMEIEEYLNQKNIPFKEDYTNALDIYTRNKIRLKVLPYIEQHINNKVVEHVSLTAKILKDEEDFMESFSQQVFRKLILEESNEWLSISIEKFKELHRAVKKRVIRIILLQIVGHLNNLESIHINQVLELVEKQVGKNINLPNKVLVKKDYETLIFMRNSISVKKESIGQIKINIPGTHNLESLGKIIKTEVFEHKKDASIPKKIYTKWFDYDKIIGTLSIRSREPGDFIAISKVNGRKKIKTFFIDEKIPQEQRACIPLLTDGHHIIWIIGYRISEHYKVTENTKRILSVEILDIGGPND
jgi:tRNA(Ile)-lysidine synthase